MKKIFLIYIFAIFLGVGLCGAKDGKEKDVILIISSYNPDTKRMSSFINDFEDHITKTKHDYQVLIEDMACKSIQDSLEWKQTLITTLDRYKNNKIKGVILLGQEAFATYISLDYYPKDVPFFACFASENGIDMFSSQAEKLPINMPEKSVLKGAGGGFLNRYNVENNIELILNLFPDTKNIAFVSDNTYGGISLKAHVKSSMSNYPDLNLINIDSRCMSQGQAQNMIANLPKHTALLIGTWRVDKDGMYMMSNALSTLTSLNPDLPIFSLTGSGIGSIAIGGYIPKYKTSGQEVAGQINNYYNGKRIEFKIGDNEYRFDRDMLTRFSLRESHLPKDSIITDNAATIIATYRNYIIIAILVIVMLVVLSVWLYKIIVEKRKLQKELITARDHAQESDRMKTSFLANMGHEIRTPLNSIVGFSNLVCEENLSEEEKNEYCLIINKNSEMLLTLINDILDISRMESGRMQFHFSEVEVSSICQQVIYTTSHLKKEGVEFIFIPDTVNAIINTDIQRISQILINIITNAMKFTNEGSVTLSYKIEEGENRVLFMVADTGCGIPKEMHSKVFNRFEKVNEYKQGTGLGLAICKQLSTHLGADIWLDPDYTDGAQFVFSHPIISNES